jgi:hypothetical protein
MKKFFRFAAIAVAAIALFSCEKPQGDDTQTPGGNEKPEQTVPEYKEDLTFTLEVVEVEADQAKIKVEHNGTTKDTWYGFATTESDVNKAIKDVLAEGNVKLKKNIKTTMTVENLEPETEYTFIAVGIKADGTTYGETAKVKFTTAADANKPLTLNETDEWKISYERGTNNGEVAELFTITCQSGFYFTTVAKQTLEVNNIEIADYVAYVIGTEVPDYLKMGYKWEELYVPESYKLAYPRFVSGDYIAIAVGYNESGKPSGTYSTQEFTVVEESATAEYTQWIGNWDIIDKYQYQDETTGEYIDAQSVYHITLHHYDNNYMYYMTGWEENNEDGYIDIREYVGEYGVPVYFNNGKIEFVETYLDYVDFGDYGYYNFGFYGMGNVTQGTQKYEGTLVAMNGATMGIGEMLDGGKTATITGNTISSPQITIEYLGMLYCGYPDGNGELAYWNYPMEFPLDMVKTTENEPAVQACTVPTQKNTSLKADSRRKMHAKTVTPRYL